MLLLAIALASIGGSHRLVSRVPAWMDWVLAGYSLENSSTVGVYDSKRNYYLLRDSACDGADVSISLTRDRNYACEEGFHVPNFTPHDGENGSQELTHKALKNLSTGHGVTIGDTPKALVAKLGPPTKKARSGSREQFRDYIYRWIQGRGDDVVVYEETYTFKQDKLIEIIFSKAPDGDDEE